MTNKYMKDQAEPEGNIRELDSIFNVEITTNQVVDRVTGQLINSITGEVIKSGNPGGELAEVGETPDVDKIILDNIDRANRLLDAIEKDIISDNGNVYTASLIEATSTLINTVTSAANSVTGISMGQEQSRQKDRALDLKEKEIAIKGIMKGEGNVTVNNNSLVMNREDLMRMINEGEDD